MNCCCFRLKEVTFPEFVQYVLWDHIHNVHADRHWQQQYDLCQPCHIKYDAIGFYETMRDDAEYILRKITAGSDVGLVPRSKDTRTLSSDYLLKLYDKVPLNDIRNLLAVYKKDYSVFGYQIPKRILSRLRE